jgi:hypothetical protein
MSNENDGETEDPIGSETGDDLLPFAARILTPKRLKEWYVATDKLWLEIEGRYKGLSEPILREIKRADRREYDARRDTRPRGHKGANSKPGSSLKIGRAPAAILSRSIARGWKSRGRDIAQPLSTSVLVYGWRAARKGMKTSL